MKLIDSRLIRATYECFFEILSASWPHRELHPVWLHSWSSFAQILHHSNLLFGALTVNDGSIGEISRVALEGSLFDHASEQL